MQRQLYESIIYRKVKKTREIIQHPDVDVNEDTRRGLPFHNVCLYGNTEQIQMFLAHDKIEPNIRNHYGETALHIVCFWEKNKAIKKLLNDERIDINSEDSSGVSCVVFAILHNDIEIVEFFMLHKKFDPDALQRRFKKNQRSETWLSLIELARYYRRYKTAKLLESYIENPELVIYQLKLKHRIPQAQALNLFALSIMCSDEYLLNNKKRKFFEIIVRLPIEIQMIICNFAYKINKKDNIIISNNDLDSAFIHIFSKCMAKKRSWISLLFDKN
jgi:hypothetical protein